MRRRILNLVVSFIILTLTLSFVTVLPVAGHDTSTIRTKLEELRSKVESEHPALENKINAVIHQIRAGAFSGALNKLQNDVKKSILAWVDDPEDLIELVDEIIKLIEEILCKPKPDFRITAHPTELEIGQGGSDTSTITITSQKGFHKEVVLRGFTSASGITLSLDPPTVTPPRCGSANSTLRVEVGPDVEQDEYEIIVTGTSGSLEHSVNILLKVVAAPSPTPNFSITASPSPLTIQQGDSNISVITVTSLQGFNKSVGLEVTSEPITGVNATLYPMTVITPPNSFAISILRVDAAIDALLGTHNITVTGVSGTLTHQTNISIIVRAPPVPPTPDFSLIAYPSSLTIEQGDSATSTLIVVSKNGFNKPVNLTIASEPIQGVTIKLNPAQVTPEPNGFATSTLTIIVGATTTPKDYQITVKGTSGDLQKTVSISLKIILEDTPPDILSVLRFPETPSYNENVTVLAFVTDAVSGVKQVTLNYTDGREWTAINMTLSMGLYKASIPAFRFNTTVEYYVLAKDNADNMAQSSLYSYKLTVDNTLPSAVINAPAHGSFLRRSVLIKVTGNDANFDRMEVRIDNELVRTSFTSGTEILEWNTRNYADGVHSITLTVYDKAGNRKQALVDVTIDNTPPVIGTPSWSPKEPAANVDIQINVTVTEPTYASGMQNVTLWFKNKTMEEWQFIPMQLENGNWTATLSNQSDTDVKFFIEAFDKAGNRAETDMQKFTVAPPPSFPLIWILIAVLAIAAIIGGTAYYAKKKQKKSTTASSVPIAASPPTIHPSSSPAPKRKSTGRRT